MKIHSNFTENVNVINTTNHWKLIPILQKWHCNAREQATSDYFGRNSTKYNNSLVSLAPFKSSGHMKPISKDEECTHITSTKSRGECNLFHKYIVAVHVQ